MARAVIALGLGVASGCFHATPYSPAAAQEQWRALRDASAERAPRGREGIDADAATAGPGLTAEQTYALALANSSEVAALEALAETSSAEIQAARQLENPQLRLTGFDVDDVISSQPALNIGLRMPIPRPGTIRARVAGAKVAAEGRRSLSADARRLLRERVFKLYARLAMRSAELEQAAQVVALRDERRVQLAARAEQAVATSVDVAMAEVLYAEAKQAEAEVRIELADVEEELARLAGTRGAVKFQVDPAQLRVESAALDRDALIDRALESRPELHAAHAQLVEAQAQVHLARSEAWPWFEWAQLQYRAAPGGTPTAFGFGVALTLPILSWNRGAIKASRATVRQRELEERARIVAIAGEVDEAVGRVERTAARVAELERELLPAVEEATRQAEAAIATGALDPLVANEIQVRAVTARRTHLAALLEHREAVIELDTVIGEADP